MLSWIVFLPLAGVLLCAVLPKSQAHLAKWIALATTAADLALAAVMLARFDAASAAMQFVTDLEWVPQAGIRYALGVDGMSAPLVALSALLTMLAVIASWTVDKKPSFYCCCRWG